mmetsp:Transcript_35649/g.65342  ORF Transcript_35649/g.65342 Transcript_35649/m.65342 type:complete len:373 (+) Transcript_35649:54-1172(+)
MFRRQLCICACLVLADVRLVSSNDPLEPLPVIANRGKEEFLALAEKTANSNEGQTGEVKLNVLQMPVTASYWAAWEWADFKRKPALILDDMENEYYPYVKPILPQVELLLKAFRAAGLPVFWSTWWRFGPDDGHYNAMDRFYGARGWNTSLNALYLHTGKKGGAVIDSVAPQSDIEMDRYMRKSYSLDVFDEHRMDWVTGNSKQSLHDRLMDLGVDTVVLVGAWTDDCIMSAAFHAFSLQYDVVVVEDGVSTASLAHYSALDVMKGSCAKVMMAKEVAGFVAPEVVAAAAADAQHPIHQMSSTSSLANRPPRLQASLHEGASYVASAESPAWLQMAIVVFLSSFGPVCFVLGWLLRGQAGHKHAMANTFYAM